MQWSHHLHVRGTIFFFSFFKKKNKKTMKGLEVTQKMGSTTCNKVVLASLFFQNAVYPIKVSVFHFIEGEEG